MPGLRVPDGQSANPSRWLRPRAIILMGFMGAGKSSVGRALAAELGWAFHDLDDRIEEKEGRKVADIFRDLGEAEFRRMEHIAIASLIQESDLQSECVIALGGGAFIQKENAALIEACGIPTVFLDAEVEELWKRCQHQMFEAGVKRPLLKDPHHFRDLYEQRRPHYMQAKFRHETGGKPVPQIARELIDVLKLERTRKSGFAGRDKRR